MPLGPKSSGTRPIRRAPAPASSYYDEDQSDPPRRGNFRPARSATQDAEDDGRPVNRRTAQSREEPDPSEFISSGWGGAKQLKKEMPNDFAQNFTVPTEAVIIKFLQDGPFANYKQHWAEWLPQGNKLSYVCIKVDCPICGIGDKPQAKFCFNIVDFTDPENPVNAVLSVGRKVSDVIEEYAQEARTSPINREDLYFSIKKTGTSGGGSAARKGGTVQTNISPVKARDLASDWGFEPLTEDELVDFEERCYVAKDYASPSTREQLEAVADAYQG